MRAPSEAGRWPVAAALRGRPVMLIDAVPRRLAVDMMGREPVRQEGRVTAARAF